MVALKYEVILDLIWAGSDWKFLNVGMCEKEEIAVSAERRKHQKQKRNASWKRLPMLGTAHGLDEF